MKKTNQKFALFEYATENIGDEIQSIAARRFIPEIDYFVNRDELSRFTIPDDEEVKLIMNGWYMHKPEHWPPIAKGLHPLLVSMYVDQKNPKVIEAFTSKKSVEFLTKYGPVGARDKVTLEFFEKNNIPAYFSGCVTLTLERDKKIPRQDYVLAVDVSPKMSDFLKKSTNRPVINVSTYYDPNLPREARFYLAEYFLYLYQSAHCVISTRLHATLPSLAFETPVLLVKEAGKFEKDRYSGLGELAHSATEADFMKNPQLFNLDTPPENKSDYMKIRNNLIKVCQAYTGYTNPRHTYRTVDFSLLYKEPMFISIFGEALASTYNKLLLEGDVSWQKKVNKADNKRFERTVASLNSVIAEQNKRIEELAELNHQILTSTSWKVTAPLRTIKTKVDKIHKQQ